MKPLSQPLNNMHIPQSFPNAPLQYLPSIPPRNPYLQTIFCLRPIITDQFAFSGGLYEWTFWSDYFKTMQLFSDPSIHVMVYNIVTSE